MTEEQITNRYVRGWISLAEFRAELVKLYDREDAREAKEAAATARIPKARKGWGYWGDGIIHVDYMGREYTVSSIGNPYVQVLLHAERNAPAGSTYPSGKTREFIHYVRKVDPKGPLGQMLIAAAKEIA